jgi:hypothetical protein
MSKKLMENAGLARMAGENNFMAIPLSDSTIKDR